MELRGKASNKQTVIKVTVILFMTSSSMAFGVKSQAQTANRNKVAWGKDHIKAIRYPAKAQA